MHSTNFFKAAAGPAIVLVLVSAGWLTRATWTSLLFPATDAEAKKATGSDNPERVKISAQAQKYLRLDVKAAKLRPYERKLKLPGTVVDKPGHSDRGIPAPISGVVTNVYAIPGKTVRAGDELFRLRLVSDTFQASQMELYKATRELEIAKKEYKRLETFPNAVANTRFLELEYQQDRLNAVIQAHQQDLLTRQLTPPQVAAIEKGRFVTEVVILMPERLGKHHAHDDALPVPIRGGPGGSNSGDPLPVPRSVIEFEVQELKVNLGDHVQAGQMLAYLADHRFLYIEARALKQEAGLLAEATRKGWAVEADFTEDEDEIRGDRVKDLTIEFLGNTMDASGMTLPVYVPFANPHRDYVRQGRSYRTGLYRPGQRVQLKVTIAKLDEAFVLPTAAVAREGVEAYVFRQNGSAFDRRPVHVLFEDADEVVIADDGSILAGNYIAHNGAAALNRALKASQGEGGGGHGHSH